MIFEDIDGDLEKEDKGTVDPIGVDDSARDNEFALLGVR